MAIAFASPPSAPTPPRSRLARRHPPSYNGPTRSIAPHPNVTPKSPRDISSCAHPTPTPLKTAATAHSRGRSAKPEEHKGGVFGIVHTRNVDVRSTALGGRFGAEGDGDALGSGLPRTPTMVYIYK
ncbi:hypothetical protein B0H11DRAFT_2252173 [Mycena galericulata]|nr:hypothetical protein B0H11DRAFT_2252173 [Mycena galericulata]